MGKLLNQFSWKQINFLPKWKWSKGRTAIIFVVAKNEQIWLINKVTKQQNPLFKGTEMDLYHNTKIVKGESILYFMAGYWLIKMPFKLP